MRDVDTTYRRGETARASFVGANPRNDLRLEGSYAVLEKKRDDGDGDSAEVPEWRAVRDDTDRARLRDLAVTVQAADDAAARATITGT